MVLLTSTAISVAISSTVVCTFTFLLFLSGYVLQQQTVQSLQEALHRPPEPKPVITLPDKFRQTDADDTQEPEAAKDGVIEIVGEKVALPHTVQLPRVPARPASDWTVGSAQELFFPPLEVPATPPGPPTASSGLELASSTPDPKLRLAYILGLSTPAQICSALLFFKQQRESGTQKASLFLLYPSIWEDTRSEPSHNTVLDLMRDAQDAHDIILHPVHISTVWEGISVESQLLAELQRSWMRWGFDRSMYLRSPGFATDVSILDKALRKSNLKKSWAPLSSAPQDTPNVMLMSARKGLIMVPRGEMRGLTASAMTGKHEEHHSKEMDVEALLASKKAGYVVFDELELEHRRTEKEWYGGIFEKFERGRREVCEGTMFVPAVKKGKGM